MRADREVDGRGLVKQREHLQSLSPEVRARAEDLLRHKGATPDEDPASVARMCFTPGKLSDGRWHGVDSTCTTSFSEQDDRAWKWHASCRQSETNGVATFAGAELYTFRTEATFNVNGVARVMKTSATFKWLGEDCGTVR